MHRVAGVERAALGAPSPGLKEFPAIGFGLLFKHFELEVSHQSSIFSSDDNFRNICELWYEIY